MKVIKTSDYIKTAEEVRGELSSVAGDYTLYYKYTYNSDKNKIRITNLLKATSDDEITTDSNFLHNLYYHHEDIVISDIKKHLGVL